jgi:hypothetical protein
LLSAAAAVGNGKNVNLLWYKQLGTTGFLGRAKKI